MNRQEEQLLIQKMAIVAEYARSLRLWMRDMCSVITIANEALLDSVDRDLLKIMAPFVVMNAGLSDECSGFFDVGDVSVHFLRQFFEDREYKWYLNHLSYIVKNLNALAAKNNYMEKLEVDDINVNIVT